MTTFPAYQPAYSAAKRSQPKTRTAKFGDGFETRILFGLNQNPKEWSLTFNLPDVDADVIEAFLDARAADSTSFSWTPIGAQSPSKWVCPEWNREYTDLGVSRITATFRQVFEP